MLSHRSPAPRAYSGLGSASGRGLALPKVNPLLDPKEERLAYFDGARGGPKYPEIDAFCQEIEELHWTAEEHADFLRDDQLEWPDLDPRVKQFVRYFLALFLYGDELVMRNLTENVTDVVTIPEVRAFFRLQAAQEQVHAKAYSFQVFGVLGPEEAEEMEREAKEWPEIRHLIDWADAWMNKSVDFFRRMLAFACFEGIIFSGAFVALQSLRELRILNGITIFNEFISRDEGLHCRFQLYLLRTFGGVDEISTADAHSIVGGAAAGAATLCLAALLKEGVESGADGSPYPDPEARPEDYNVVGGGITAAKLVRYVEWSSNVLLRELGYPDLYRDVRENPLPMMEKMALNRVDKTNFFEFRPTAYQGAQSDTFVWAPADASGLDLGGGVKTKPPAPASRGD
jgi:ribonucleoside-diphosphate reductase beta chain/ribonucleoside-diphosphate reductase subunit M2